MIKYFKYTLLLFLITSLSYADVPKGSKKSSSSQASLLIDSSYSFETNNLYADITNNGSIIDYHLSGDNGMLFKDVGSVFQSSIWVAGKINGSIRTIVGDYTQDMGPGPWGGDPLSATSKIYFVDVEMLAAPQEYDDFQNWPVDQGAPFIDVDGNGIYNPLPTGDDYPKFVGDKVAFFVSNDGDPAYKLNFGTSPLNLEMQFLIYSFDQSVDENLANSLFYQVVVINKGTDTIEDTYLAIWSDDDLGNAGDDLSGISIERSLSYTYNDGEDSQMSNGPFSKGVDFLQGPMVACDASEDCSTGAKMYDIYHPGMKNLQASSHAFYVNGDATYTDPSDETEAYFYLQGLRKDGSSYPESIGGANSLGKGNFAFWGDPRQALDTNGNGTVDGDELAQNPVDGYYAAAADRRSLIGIGPFELAAGDSQQVVFNLMHGEGTTALDALTALFTANDSLQSYYDNDFELLKDVNDDLSITATASSSSGYAPFSVAFNVGSTYNFIKYYWDFDGDGTIDSYSSNPTYVYTEPGTYTATASASYKYYDNGKFNLRVVSDSVSITVISDDDIIEIASESISVNEDASIRHGLDISNTTNRNFDLQLALQPSNGTAFFTLDSLNYVPNNNFNGLDSLKVYAKDGTYSSDSATIAITVLPVDDSPVTNNITATVQEDAVVAVYLSASEFDGDTYSFAIKSQPSFGSLSEVLSSAGVDSIIYTPNPNWFGVDQFTFEASDSSTRTNIGTAIITVLPENDAPTTSAVSVNTYEDLKTSIELDFSDIDGDWLSLSFSSPSHGSATSNGLYIDYEPNENFYGEDSLKYYVYDGTVNSNISDIVINIEAVNDASSDFTADNEYIISSEAGEEWIISTNNLIATRENEQDSLQFNWDESFDIDGDEIQYRMVGFDALSFLTMENWIKDLTLSWSIKDLVSNTDTVNVATGSWMIIATDGEYFKESNFGNPMELFINGSALVPDEYSLNQNYPNPFNGSTTITYDMPENQMIMIRIFDVRGRLIRTLVNEDQNAGFKSVVWDGKNENGEKVSSGVYFYQMHASSSASSQGLTKTRKMIKIE